ncbi:MarR family winged helix-turn-helix transcriptional regulator [Arenibacter echinorum]|uniref:DNA-binding MarR family transcriptional regulator n=1 Tax=Arenibacter echinorum TaxID=440515 RepID=A0A327R1C0_9FLAO|nr:MarR family transcriptional regulator [Arenibacter echinorum]RAJ10055.1 DNA-binding MarR family transcriptional regulator [Arenibacter echinorum]
MDKSIFNPDHQEKDVTSKIIAGLERVSEAFKVLLWDKAKLLGLSPIQIQILIFIAYHKNEICNVSHLAKEFNITKPTISDAIRVLDKKGLITKEYSSSDSRSYSIGLSETGTETIGQISDFANPLKMQLNTVGDSELESLFGTLSKLIYQLNTSGILSVQRTCYGCKFYSKESNQDYCNLLNKELLNKDIRLDCPEFEVKHT